MFDESLATFSPWGLSHILAIVFAAVAVAMCVVFRKKVQKNRFLEIVIGSIMLLLETVYMIWQFRTQGFRVEQLPLNLCTLSLYVNIFMLITGLWKPVRYTCFWTLAGPVLAVIIPMQGYEFPHYRFIHYYLNHILIILTTLYLVYVNGAEISLKDTLFSEAGMTALVLFVVHPVNTALGTEFMFFAQRDNYFEALFTWRNVGIFLLAAVSHQIMFWIYHLFMKRSNR